MSLRGSVALAVIGTTLLASQGCGSDERRVGFAPADAALPSEPTFGADAGAVDARDDATCAGTVVALTRSPVYMLVIMDGSGSMLDPITANGPPGLKWQAASDAMVSFISSAEAAKDPSFGLGLFLFDGTHSVLDFAATDVGIDYVSANHAAALRGRIQGSEPQGGTPIKRALEGQIGILESFLPYTPLKKGGKRVLVVMTDGVPDGPSDIQPQVQQQCVDLVQSARTGKGEITTFAVGVGEPSSEASTYNEVFVGRLAVAGGAAANGCKPGWSEASPPGDVPCHFQVTPGQKSAAQIRDDLLAAINTIRGEAASCELELVKTDGSPGVPDPSKVNVFFTDAQGKQSFVAKDAADGWTFDDAANPSAVVLHGEACKRLKAESDGKVAVELGCTTRVN